MILRLLRLRLLLLLRLRLLLLLLSLTKQKDVTLLMLVSDTMAFCLLLLVSELCELFGLLSLSLQLLVVLDGLAFCVTGLIVETHEVFAHQTLDVLLSELHQTLPQLPVALEGAVKTLFARRVKVGTLLEDRRELS